MIVVPAVHPAFIMRRNMRLSGTFEHALGKAVNAAYKGWRPAWNEKNFVLRPNADEVVSVLKSMHGRAVAWDVETDGGHPLNNQLRCIGFYDGVRAITVPLLYRDGTREDVLVKDRKGNVEVQNKAVWKKFYTGEAEKKVLAAIKALLSGGAKLLYTQNGQYDRTVMRAHYGFAIKAGDSGYTFDSMVAHHVLAPYLPHGLGFLGALYTEAPFYKSTDDGKAWSAESDHELWLYCARDCKVTWEVCERERAELKDFYPAAQGVFEQDTWQEEQCQEWKRHGILVDTQALDYFRKHYRTVRDRALVKMKEVLAQVSIGSNDENFVALLEKLSAKADVEMLDDDWSGRTVEAFNPASLRELRLLLKGLKMPLSEVTATGELSTAKELLTGARKELLNQGVDPNDPRIAFLDYLFAWRESSKVESTYLYPEILFDGRVHPNFNVHIVPSGRLSSSDPNFQNQPAEVRGMYAASEDHVLVSMDWDALEMRLGAFLSGDKRYIEVFKQYDAKTGPKPHHANMANIFGLEPTKKAAEANPGMYRAAKVFAYAVAYGAGEETVFEQVREELPDMRWDDFLLAFGNYKKAYPELFAFQADVVRRGTKNGYLDSGVMGRRIFFFERAWNGTSPEATAMQNFPYQCYTGDMRVLTANGYEKLGELSRKTSSCVAWTGQRWAGAQVIKKGIVPIYRVTLKNGIEVEVDATHGFLAERRGKHDWVRTSKLKKGMRVALDLARPHETAEFEPLAQRERAWAAGFYTGNGWSSAERGDLTFVVGDSAARAEERKPATIIPRLTRLASEYGINLKARDETGCTALTAHGKSGRLFGSLLGIDPEQKAATKRIPEWVWQAPRETRAAFIVGLLDADGTVGKDKAIRLQLCQRELLQEVWLLARTCGVTGTIHGPYTVDKNGHRAWVLVLNTHQSHAHLGWGPGGKLKTNQMVPKRIAREATAGLKFKRGTSHQVIMSRIKRGGSASPYTIRAMGGRHDELYDYTEVVKVEATGRSEQVYTLSMDDAQHRYVGEGLIAKNSTGADIVGLANRRIMNELVIPWQGKLRKGEVLFQLAQVHDELLFEVPVRLAEEFMKECKRLAEIQPVGFSNWNLPVDIKADRRWKHVQARCRECRELADLEFDGRYWGGTCEKKHIIEIAA